MITYETVYANETACAGGFLLFQFLLILVFVFLDLKTTTVPYAIAITLALFASVCMVVTCENASLAYKRYRRWRLLPEPKMSESVDDCCICLEPLSEGEVVELPCRHQLHHRCASDLAARRDHADLKCPLCSRVLELM